MKTRRFLSLALSLALACSLSLPAAAAEETADQALSRVTAQVKQTLSIGGAYDEFYGSSYQNALSTVWSLNWSAKDSSSLYVEAEDDGTVISCYRSDPDYAGGGYDPAFPSLDRAQAQALVQSFLDKVLRAGLESARFDEGGSFNSQRSFYRFTGTILLNGIPSPLRFSASVRASDGAVTDFSRDSTGQTYLGGVPAAGAAVSRDEALSLLKSTLSLRLEYVRPEGEDTAVLRYLPEAGDSYYVDGGSGELVNLSELYRALEEDGSFYNTAAGGGAVPPPAPTQAAAPGGAAHAVAHHAHRAAGGRVLRRDVGVLVLLPDKADVGHAPDVHLVHWEHSPFCASSMAFRRSCPQEASISPPRLRRTVAVMPWDSSRF